MTKTPDWVDGHCAEPAVARANEAGGRDVWAELGGCPRGWREAAALYRQHGVTNLADFVTKVLGEPIDPMLAVRGDVMMANGALGICRGEVIEFMDATLPVGVATKAWRAAGWPDG